MEILLAQATTNQVPQEWWIPFVGAILVALWDILKRKFNLVEPLTPAVPAVPATPPVAPPATPPVVTEPSDRPILDIAKQLLPLLLPLVTTAVAEALKPKAEPKQ